MSQTLPDEAATIHAGQRAAWDDVADDWHGQDSALDPLVDALLRHAGVRPGAKVLDLACGAGSPALEAARLVGPSGSVLGLDLSPRMVHLARREAQRSGMVTVDFRTIDDEGDLDIDPASFHAATCKHGLMWMPSPVRALHAIYGALQPGGRVAVSTWSPPPHIPLVATLRRLAERHLNIYLPPEPPLPSPMHDESTLLSLLASAGFDDPRTERVPIIWDDWSGDDTAAGDGMWTRVLSEDQLLMDAYTLATPQRRTAFEDASSALLGRSLSLRSTIETVDMLVASARRPR